MRTPMSVPPVSRVSTAPRWVARRAACVLLPVPSAPSRAMYRPLLILAAPYPQYTGAGRDVASSIVSDETPFPRRWAWSGAFSVPAVLTSRPLGLVGREFGTGR